MMQKRLAALGGAAAAAAALAAGPAVAQAATVAAGAPCVGGVQTLHTINGKIFRTFPVSAAGFPAGAPIEFEADGSAFATGTADSTGAVSTLGDVPFFTGHHKTMQLTATDGTTTAGPVNVLVTNIGVDFHAHKPKQKIRYKAFGFFPGKRVYLFVRRGSHTKGRFSLGKAKGPCGDVTKRMRAMPVRNYSPGNYQFWFSQSRRYSKKTRIVGYRITITRTFI